MDRIWKWRLIFYLNSRKKEWTGSCTRILPELERDLQMTPLQMVSSVVQLQNSSKFLSRLIQTSHQRRCTGPSLAAEGFARINSQETVLEQVVSLIND